MLRTQAPQAEDNRSEDHFSPRDAFPGIDEPYASQDRAVGVLFYQAKQGFFLPYHHLQSMDLSATRIAIEYTGETVVITGRGLHGLGVGLARQTIWRVVEQGASASASASPTWITKIRRIAKKPEATADPGPDSESSV